VKLLFVHCNYPAQFRHLAAHFGQQPGDEVRFLAQSKEWTSEPIDGVELSQYALGRDPQGQLCHPYLRRFEAAMLHGQAAFREALKLRQQGFEPDLIVGHSGFGNTLFLKEVWPKARFVGYFEWYYRSSGSDVGFGSQEAASPDTAMRVHSYNTPIVMDLAQCDGALCPTHWQASQFPSALQQRLDVVFDGINTDYFQPLQQASPGLNLRGVTIPADQPLVTYVTRGFEPYRGWPQVAEGLALLMQRNPRVHVLLVGSDDVAYGAKRGDGVSWRQWALEQWPMDPSRLHQLPPLQYDEYRQVLQHSWVHVYWTIPFILSWSLMESLASGCCVVASDTEPVREIMRSGEQGQLVDFFDPQALAQQVDALLQDPARRQALGAQARAHILSNGYDNHTCLQRQLAVLQRVMG
jgi:glycosyltransferase involved in cell wall biosynthesis